MRYRTGNGDDTTVDDPSRLLWYGCCTYWTDDWEKVRSDLFNGIPCCPVCKCSGYQITAQKWFEGAKKFERLGHPCYLKFLMQSKEQCRGDLSFLSRYEEWFKSKFEGEIRG